jgi:hypothetical protein
LNCGENLIAIEPAASQHGTTAAEHDNNANNDPDSIIFFGFITNGGHLVRHDFFSYYEKME